MNKELIGVDFVANKGKYRESLKGVTNAEQLYVGLSRMMQDLNNGHTHLLENSNLKSRNSFHKSTSQNPRIEEAWFEALSNEESFKFYGAIREKTTKKNWIKTKLEDKKSFSNANSSSVFMKDVINENTGYLRIDRMYSDGFDEWKKDLSAFFKDNNNLDSLIIDIRNNGGGSSFFVYEVLVKPLLKEKVYRFV